MCNHRLVCEVGIVLIGVDGCPGGWYAVHLEKGDEITARVYPHFVDLLACVDDETTMAVDIPIGLLSMGSRACDVAARRALAPKRSSSVFPAPLRPMLGKATHAEASAVRRDIESKGMSIQSFAITKKVHEVDLALASLPDRATGVYEVHPEVSFTYMNGGVPMSFAKKKAAGRAERSELLARTFGTAPARLIAARDRSAVGADDVLDALVGLWTAMRLRQGTAESLPPIPEVDQSGRRMAIFY